MKTILSKLKNYVFQLLVTNDSLLKKYQIFKQENIDASSFRVLLYLVKVNFINKIENKSTTPNNNTYTNINIREPFIGVESSISNRNIPTLAALTLLRYDVISFSIFDTLVFIPFNHKHDIFWMLESKLNIIGFRHLRIKAEQQLTSSSNNYNIKDIYKEINKSIKNLDIKYGIETEIKLWKKFIYPNEYMNIIFNILVEQGKKVVIIEDTFFSKSDIAEMLNQCGYKGYTELFVSSENSYNKEDSTIYNFIKEKFCNTLLVHIGSDFKNDSKSPRESGIDTRYYNSCQAYGMKYRAMGISPLLGSVYFALINQKLHKSEKVYSQFYELGFIYGGFCLLGYTNFLLEYCNNHCIDKIIFLSSSGSFVKKIFDRFSLGKTTSVEILWNDSLHENVNNVANIIDNTIIHYITPFINEGKNILIVDNNFSGSYSLDLMLVISKISSDIQCQCVLLANPPHAQPYILGRNISTYLFDNHKNIDLYQFHNNKDYSVILELFLKDKQPELDSLKELNGGIRFEFSEPNIECYNYLEETHNGIMDFITEYMDIFRQNKFMINISGRDAYMPLKFLFNNKNLLQYYIDAIKSNISKV